MLFAHDGTPYLALKCGHKFHQACAERCETRATALRRPLSAHAHMTSSCSNEIAQRPRYAHATRLEGRFHRRKTDREAYVPGLNKLAHSTGVYTGYSGMLCLSQLAEGAQHLPQLPQGGRGSGKRAQGRRPPPLLLALPCHSRRHALGALPTFKDGQKERPTNAPCCYTRWTAAPKPRQDRQATPCKNKTRRRRRVDCHAVELGPGSHSPEASSAVRRAADATQTRRVPQSNLRESTTSEGMVHLDFALCALAKDKFVVSHIRKHGPRLERLEVGTTRITKQCVPNLGPPLPIPCD